MQLEKDTFAVALSQICCQEEETSGWIEDRQWKTSWSSPEAGNQACDAPGPQERLAGLSDVEDVCDS